MGITNIGTPQVEIALSEIGLFELAVDALKQQLELTAISDSLIVSGQSVGFKFDLNLPANTQALVSQGISAGINKGYVLSGETRNLIAQVEGIHFSWNKALFPEITPVILDLSKTGLTVQRQASLGVQNLSLTVTDVDLVIARVLNAEDTQLVFTEPIIVFRKFSLQASRISLFIQEQGTILNYNRPFRLNVYDLNLNDSNTWFMRSDLPKGVFRLVRQLESRQSIRTEDNKATIMESP